MGNKWTFQPGLGFSVMTLALVALLSALGAWQIQRLEWKTRLLAQLDLPPVALPEKIDELKDWEYRRVTVRGRYLQTPRAELRPRVHDGVMGYDLVAALRRPGGGAVLVNTGFHPDGAAVRLPAGEVTVEGFVQVPRKNRFTPGNAPAKNAWYWADPAAIMPSAAPFVVNAAARPSIANNHAQYAAFWFCMAAVTGGLYIVRGTRRHEIR